MHSSPKGAFCVMSRANHRSQLPRHLDAETPTGQWRQYDALDQGTGVLNELSALSCCQLLAKLAHALAVEPGQVWVEAYRLSRSLRQLGFQPKQGRL